MRQGGAVVTSLCHSCGTPIGSRDGRMRYTAQSFKATFKVGDFISGWGTGVTYQITAIGEQRILMMDGRNKERVSLITAQHGWVLKAAL